MRRAIYICVCLLVLCEAVGCKATKKVVEESIMVEASDTTKIVADSIHTWAHAQEDHTIMTLSDDWGSIEFVSGGGTISITDGTISAEGVKSYRQGKHYQSNEVRTNIFEEDSTIIHKAQANGVRSRIVEQSKQESQKQGVASLKWYQRAIFHIGFLCCLAAIIYSIFLYLKKKK